MPDQESPAFGQYIQGVNFAEREQELREVVSGSMPKEPGAIILDSPDRMGYFGIIGRSLEAAQWFPEMAQASSVIERASKFIYIVDSAANRYVTHSTRLAWPEKGHRLAVFQRVLADLQGQVTQDEVVAYHDIPDITRCIFIATDLAAPDVLPTRDKLYGLLSYKAMFAASAHENISHIVAYMNKTTLRALGRLGIVPDALCGRSNYHILPVGDVTFDAYQPYIIPNTEHIRRVFSEVDYASRQSRWAAVMAGTDMSILQMDDVGSAA